MKITKIELMDGVYRVTIKSNILFGIFGSKEKVRRYKTYGEVFHYFGHIKVFYNSDGSVLSPFDKICSALNNHSRQF